MVATAVLFVAGLVFPLPPELRGEHAGSGGPVCLPQYRAGPDRRRAGARLALRLHRLWRNYFFTIWYPFAYWLINMATAVVAFPRRCCAERASAAPGAEPWTGGLR